MNIPPTELDQRLSTLPLDQRLSTLPLDRHIVAYCRGPFCVYADDAVRALAAAGRPAWRLTDGYPEWAAAGLPTIRVSA